MNVDSLWQIFLDKIDQKVSQISFNTWFKNTKLHEMNDDKIVIAVNKDFQKTYLLNNFINIIDETITEITGKSFNIEFISEDEIEEERKKQAMLVQDSQIINNYNREDNDGYNYKLNSNLNPKYTFESFMIGDSNKFARTAAFTVAQNPGKIYNPLFIHGKSGLGKTHLMHAIGNYIVEHFNYKVLYVTCDQFISDFIDINIRDNNNKNNIDYVNQFKNKYRNVDVLIIDDIQFLGGAEKTQQELFHTFNHLFDLNKQIIISSDKSPDDLKFLEERLRTRFSWGLTADIYPPDFSLKLKIIKNKIKGLDTEIYIEEDVLDFIATNCENDVRHLEGSITRLMAYAAMMNTHQINLEFAREALQDYMKNNYYLKSNISKIQKAVAEYYNITIEDIKSKKRSAEINYPRQIGIYLCRLITDETTTKIGIEFGGRNHSTVIHSCEKISSDIKENTELKRTIEEIKNKIN